MQAALEQVAYYLDEAINLFSAGKTDEACEQLSQAANLLDAQIAVAFAPPLEVQPPAPPVPLDLPSAMAAAA